MTFQILHFQPSLTTTDSFEFPGEAVRLRIGNGDFANHGMDGQETDDP